ncbi:MAG: DUF3783 domain-containing protein [Clostridia bacterium]|nr:DUF3783 domain-containing protein [Clostridia bacterium]
MQPLLLCIGMEQNQLMRVSFAAMALGIRVKAVAEEEWGQTIGALCGLEPGNTNAAEVRISEPMIVMAFFDSALMDRLLKSLRDGRQTVRLKAVLTPYNQHWTCGQLYRQLCQEAAQMGKT